MKKTFLALIAMLLVGVSGAWAVAKMPAYVGQLGLTDNTGGYYVYTTKQVTIAAGESYVYTFVNYNKGSEGTNQWETWAIHGWSVDNGFFMRADADDGANGLSADGTYAITCDKKWTAVSTVAKTWLQQYNGVTVTLTVSRSTDGTTITIHHTATLADGTSTYAPTATVTNVGASDVVTYELTNELSHQVISKVVYTDASSNQSTYENYTSYITNPDFETDAAETVTPTGWTVTGDDATADNPQDKTGWIEASNWISGTKLYYSGYNGKTLSQTLSNLPAGKYTLYAQAGSWGTGNNCWLTVNGVKSTEFAVAGDIVDLSQTFNHASASNVTIGSGANWGRRIDNFTLVRTGDADPQYTVTFNAVENGTVTSSAPSDGVLAGTEVTLTVTPDADYELSTLTVKDASNNDVTVTDNKFTMPASNVTVSAEFTAIPANQVGYTNNTSAWWTAFSDYYKVESGKQAHVTFKNYSDKAENKHNWLLVTTVADTKRGGDGYAEYFVLRNDNYGWGNYYNADHLKSAFVWGDDESTFRNAMNGSSVDMYVYNKDGVIYMNSNITGSDGTNYPYSFYSDNTGVKDFTFFMTTELGHLENLNVAIADMPTVTCNTAENGTVTADVATAGFGSTVTLTVTPDAGYELSTLTVKDASNNEITVTDNKFTMPASNVTVSATFKAVTKYTVTYDANGGSEVTDETEYPSGSEVTVKANSVKSEANFAGWNTKEDGTGTTYWENGTFTITENTTLYAQWNNHTIYSEGTVGPTDKSNAIWWTAFSPYTTIKKGETYKFTFTNNGGTENWFNYVLMAANKEGHGTMDAAGYAEYFALRADNFGWGTNYKDATIECNYSDDWATWKADMASGKFVTTMNVKFTGTQFVMTSNTTDGSETNYVYNFTSTKAAEAESAVLYFCVQSAYLTDFSATPAPVVETRETAVGNYGTICLPYAAKSENVILMECDGLSQDGKSIVFNYVGETGENANLEAGVPYLYRATGAVKFTTTGTTYTEPQAENNFIGVYTEQTIPENSYFLYSKNDNTGTGDDMFHPAGTNVTADPYKCYFTELPTETTARVNSNSVVFGIYTDETTGLQTINTTVDLNKNGKFIQNGRLVIVKNGKQYNTAGQAVK